MMVCIYIYIYIYLGEGLVYMYIFACVSATLQLKSIREVSVAVIHCHHKNNLSFLTAD